MNRPGSEAPGLQPQRSFTMRKSSFIQNRTSMKSWSTCLAAALWMAAAGGAAAQPCGPGGAQCVFAADGETDDRFGEVVALSADGRTMAVGAHMDHVSG